MSDLEYFPLPHSEAGVRRDGLLWEWPKKCQSCKDRHCEGGSSGDLKVCRYGFNFQQVDDDLLVAGFVLESFNPASDAWKKKRRRFPPVPNAMYAVIVGHRLGLRKAEEQAKAESLRVQEEVFLDEEQFRIDYLAALKDEILRGLSFVHDYKQINSQIIQNINVVIETRYQGTDFEAKLRSASREEHAIYWAGHFLNEKLNVARFLVRPEWLQIRDECSKFRVHGMVLKYIRIYEPWYARRGIRLKLRGQSHGEVIGNPLACGVLPHTFIDNAWKYSPDGSEVEVFVGDVPDGVLLEVSSFGPLILEDERRAIFRPFTRGVHAKGIAEEGTGYGLYVSELIAREHLGTEVVFEQDRNRTAANGRLWTTFGVTFPHVALVAST